MHGVDAKIFDLAGNDVRDDLVLANNFATSAQIDDRLQGSAAADLVLQRNIHFFALVQGRFGTPDFVPQSGSMTVTDCATSQSLRVR